MDSKQFHTVEAKLLESITVDDILTGKSISPNQLDYSVPVPTTDQRLPDRSREPWLVAEMGNINSGVHAPDSSYRGRIGGC